MQSFLHILEKSYIFLQKNARKFKKKAKKGLILLENYDIIKYNIYLHCSRGVLPRRRI